MSDAVACGIQYRRPGPPQPRDRIVRCQLDAGHEGDHEEVDTGSKWPSGIADLVGLDPNFTDGLSTNEYMRALRCSHYDECKAAEMERDQLAAELAQAKSDRERTVAVHTQAYDELSRASAQRDESETQRAVQFAELGAANASLIRRVADLENQLAEAKNRTEEHRLAVGVFADGMKRRQAELELLRPIEQAARAYRKASDALQAFDGRRDNLGDLADAHVAAREAIASALDAYDPAGKGETDGATAGTNRRCCETVNRINDELRRIGILHPLGVAGVRDLAAMASGRLEDLKTLQAQRDKVLALCDEADREQNCPNSGNHNGNIIEGSFICWQCNGTGRLDGAECVETKDLRAVYVDSRAGQAGGED